MGGTKLKSQLGPSLRDDYCTPLDPSKTCQDSYLIQDKLWMRAALSQVKLAFTTTAGSQGLISYALALIVTHPIITCPSYRPATIFELLVKDRVIEIYLEGQ